jgi:predicted metal-binding membrane protein
MLLLFVGGVMNLLWIATIAIVVLVEKLLPSGSLYKWISGALLICLALFFWQ